MKGQMRKKTTVSEEEKAILSKKAVSSALLRYWNRYQIPGSRKNQRNAECRDRDNAYFKVRCRYKSSGEDSRDTDWGDRRSSIGNGGADRHQDDIAEIG